MERKRKQKTFALNGCETGWKNMVNERIWKKNYDKVAYISFYNNKRMDDVFQMDFDINRIIMNLNIESGVTITPGDTLIILDEIQDSPKVLESLKYFCEEASEYHVVAAGSLLGVAIHEDVSYPVGKVSVLAEKLLLYRWYACCCRKF
ncbi:MAG: AAA family ATPase [Lachnospiraceae bacterium]|nr:MAG: AAA family ATPase [Lachnospiraceae bacterium]